MTALYELKKVIVATSKSPDPGSRPGDRLATVDALKARQRGGAATEATTAARKDPSCYPE